MRIKRLLITTVVSLAMASLIALGFSKWRDSQIKPPPPSVEPLPNSIVVYCLHDYARGPDCRTIEKFVREAIDETLADELAAGKVTLTLANFEHPGNAFLIEQYDVRKPTIVIVDGRPGMNRAWTNHQDKIWALLVDEQQFKQYIQAEIKKVLEASPPPPPPGDGG